MYNNDVTYDKKWDTKENIAWQDKVEKRFFNKSICAPSCPTSWAQEVYELLSQIDDELGIRWNEETMRAYRIQGKWYFLLTFGPFVAAANSLYYSMIGYKKESKNKFQYTYYSETSLPKKVTNAVSTIPSTFRYGLTAFRVQVISGIMNRIFKPKFTLSQVKEKYGRLEIYFSAPPQFDDYIEHLIAKTQVKLAIKGAYYPLESMYDYSTSRSINNEWEPDDYVVKNTEYGRHLSKTTHRTAMKELGVDTTEMAKKSTFRKEEEASDNKKQDKSV